jgi:hypothetical protein
MKPIVLGARDRLSIRRGVEVDCQVVTDADFRLVGIRARDISTRGMLVISSENIAIGEELLLSMKLPRTQIWIDAEAVVVRHVRGRRDGDRARGLGIHFTKLDTISRVMLSTSLIGLPPPIPSRSVRKDYARTVWRIANDNGVDDTLDVSRLLVAA